jgi:signal transduction histidine kinase
VSRQGPPENLVRIFNHGFATRKNGHGLGLHIAALVAREMGGHPGRAQRRPWAWRHLYAATAAEDQIGVDAAYRCPLRQPFEIRYETGGWGTYPTVIP